MRAAVLADIHSNLTALLAVLQDAEGQRVDQMWCLGDVVGYGPDPSVCLTLVRNNAALCLAGNHDLGAAGKLAIDGCNPPAAEAPRWTASQLNEDEKAYLGRLPSRLDLEGTTLAHASPREPVWEYVLSAEDAFLQLPEF